MPIRESVVAVGGSRPWDGRPGHHGHRGKVDVGCRPCGMVVAVAVKASHHRGHIEEKNEVNVGSRPSSGPISKQDEPMLSGSSRTHPEYD